MRHRATILRAVPAGEVTTMPAIAQATGLPRNAVHYQIRSLDDDGCIEWLDGESSNRQVARRFRILRERDPAVTISFEALERCWPAQVRA